MMLTVFFHLRELQQGNPLFSEGQVKLYAALVAIMIAGIPTSHYAGLSLTIVFTDYINIALFFFLFFKVVDSTEKISKVLLIGCLGNGIYSAFTVTTGNFSYGRIYFGGMFDPNDLSFFALSFMPLNLIFLSRERPLWIRLACLSSFGVCLLLILLTGSRGGMVALAGISILLLLTKSLALKPFMKIACLMLGLSFVALAPINWERYETILEPEDDYNLKDEDGRIAIWKIGLKTMIENPVTGVGVGNFSMAIGLDRKSRNLERQAWQTAHNMAVQIGTETGVIGFALFLMMSANVFRILIRVRANSSSDTLIRISEMGNAGFLGLLISGMFLSQAYSLYWAFYIALSASVNRLLSNEMKRKLMAGPK
jgi:O-antigen ligase